MKAIVKRLRRLENGAAPAERERAAAENDSGSRTSSPRRRLRADYVTFGLVRSVSLGGRSNQWRS